MVMLPVDDRNRRGNTRRIASREREEQEHLRRLDQILRVARREREARASTPGQNQPVFNQPNCTQEQKEQEQHPQQRQQASGGNPLSRPRLATSKGRNASIRTHPSLQKEPMNKQDPINNITTTTNNITNENTDKLNRTPANAAQQQQQESLTSPTQDITTENCLVIFEDQEEDNEEEPQRTPNQWLRGLQLLKSMSVVPLEDEEASLGSFLSTNSKKKKRKKPKFFLKKSNSVLKDQDDDDDSSHYDLSNLISSMHGGGGGGGSVCSGSVLSRSNSVLSRSNSFVSRTGSVLTRSNSIRSRISAAGGLSQSKHGSMVAPRKPESISIYASMEIPSLESVDVNEIFLGGQGGLTRRNSTGSMSTDISENLMQELMREDNLLSTHNEVDEEDSFLWQDFHSLADPEINAELDMQELEEAQDALNTEKLSDKNKKENDDNEQESEYENLNENEREEEEEDNNDDFSNAPTLEPEGTELDTTVIPTIIGREDVVEDLDDQDTHVMPFLSTSHREGTNFDEIRSRRRNSYNAPVRRYSQGRGERAPVARSRSYYGQIPRNIQLTQQQQQQPPPNVEFPAFPTRPPRRRSSASSQQAPPRQTNFSRRQSSLGIDDVFSRQSIRFDMNRQQSQEETNDPFAVSGEEIYGAFDSSFGSSHEGAWDLDDNPFRNQAAHSLPNIGQSQRQSQVAARMASSMPEVNPRGSSGYSREEMNRSERRSSFGRQPTNTRTVRRTSLLTNIREEMNDERASSRSPIRQSRRHSSATVNNNQLSRPTMGSRAVSYRTGHPPNNTNFSYDQSTNRNTTFSALAASSTYPPPRNANTTTANNSPPSTTFNRSTLRNNRSPSAPSDESDEWDSLSWLDSPEHGVSIRDMNHNSSSSSGLSYSRRSSIQTTSENPFREVEPSRATAAPVLLEISPGVHMPLRGSIETWAAIRNGKAVTISCVVCQVTLRCVNDAAMVLCPECSVLSPLEGSPEPTRGHAGGGVGLGILVQA